MNKFIILSLICTSLFNCDKRPDTRGYKEELKDRAVMRVTDGQLTQFASKKAKEIIDSLEKTTRLPMLSPLANSLIDTIAAKYKFTIVLNQWDKIPKTSKAFEVIDAYIYNVKNKIANEDNIQKISNGDSLIYNRAIVLKDTLWGMWTLTMSKKELIKRITLKDIKATY